MEGKETTTRKKIPNLFESPITLEKLAELSKIDLTNVRIAVVECARSMRHSATKEVCVFISALAYWRKKFDLTDMPHYRKTITKNIPPAIGLQGILEEMVDRWLDDICVLADQCSEDELLAYTLLSSGHNKRISTNEHLFKVVENILELKNTDSLIDITADDGDFFINAYLKDNFASFCGGIGRVSHLNGIIKLRAFFFGTDKFVVEDYDTNQKKYDKVFLSLLNPPPKVRDENPDIEPFVSCYDLLPQSLRLNWFYISAAISRLASNGRAVILTFDNILQRSSKVEINLRKRLVEMGLIEAAVAFPQGSLTFTNAAPNLLVLSSNNKEVKMIDARDLKNHERGTNGLTLNNANEILKRFNEENIHSRLVTSEEMKSENFNLSPVVYLKEDDLEIEGGVKLSNVVLKIERGKAIPSPKLHENQSDEPTDYQYFSFANAEAGVYPYLKEFDKSLEKFCLNEGDLIISRSAPYKLMIMPKLEAKNVLAVGNLYFLRFNPEKIDSIYALCYLKSEEGRKQFEILSKGSAISMITMQDLTRVQIPLIPMEEQKAIAQKYRALRDELDDLEEKKKDLEDKLLNLVKR